MSRSSSMILCCAALACGLSFTACKKGGEGTQQNPEPTTTEPTPTTGGDDTNANNGGAMAPTGEAPTPEDATKAKTAPTAEDLARFTSDLGSGTLHATIRTTMGDFECELYEKQAPVTVANFVGLSRGIKAWTMPIVDPNAMPPVKEGEVQLNTPLYKDVLCHRVIPGFMIQCGDPSGTGMGGPGYQIPDEFDSSLRHDTGAILSMANAGPNTGGSQFFITEVPTPHLDNRHTVFGKCDKPALVKEIASVPRGAMDRPTTDVKIKEIKISRK